MTKMTRRQSHGAGIAIGVGLGAALMGTMGGAGMAVGIAIGVAIAGGLGRQAGDDTEQDDAKPADR